LIITEIIEIVNLMPEEIILPGERNFVSLVEHHVPVFTGDYGGQGGFLYAAGN
jgi:hypothetical protein